MSEKFIADEQKTEPQTLRAMAARLERVEKLCEHAANYSMKGFHLAQARTMISWAAMIVAVIALIVSVSR